ncbi:acyltransferase family protein [Silvimonas iriomotensis]|uniref:Acyltransferase 3 domain-containing protein n=1 Tax=Silvimonas iriomotensis TaxID=449662 RepID=A0ABQ2P7T1_9NEIS|nr:acyltransferase [Silvimonas iriomotensis]GGP20486.1 hypothetical protein GCM10010970_15450 [Silvimonas iriomotensis]
MLRDPLLDGLKGFAVISVVFIHSVFWSGDSYTPAWLHGACLWLDVPLFFFLAGWSCSKVASPRKTWLNLWRLQWRYMAFVSVVWLGYVLSGHHLPALRLLEWYLHDYRMAAGDDVVMGSMWFMRVYLGVSAAAIALIWFHERAALTVALVLVGTLFLSQLAPDADWDTGWLPIVAFGMFYLPLFLLGYCHARQRLPWYWFALITLQAIWQLCCTPQLHDALVHLQTYKFPPQALYFACSWLSLCTLLLLTRWRPVSWLFTQEPLRWVGRNAIYVFFAQGVSATLIYAPVSLLADLQLPWYILLPPMFALNLYCALMGARLLKAVEALVMAQWPGRVPPRAVPAPVPASTKRGA